MARSKMCRTPLPIVFCATVSLIAWHFPALANQDPERIAFFEKNVRPLLLEHCVDCHSADNAESELSVDSLAGLLRGGIRGPALIPGDADKSLLISAVRHGEILKMPPKSKLKAKQVADLAKWVQEGAVWPGAEPATTPTSENETAAFSTEQEQYWAFQPPTRPQVPVVRDGQGWTVSPIDRFVLRRLEENGFQPAPPADRRTLIRRATFDLTGLPPTPEEVEAFLRDEQPGAFRRVVDRLLSSPRYGERWGRHWLDVARYADSNGMDENLAYANAYRYRDYVIDSFNSDKPFDDFVREQIAGDLLGPGDSLQEWKDRLTATGFLSLGPKMLAEDDPVKMQMDIIDEQIDTIGRAFMGLTLGCARCHDHKFDPISTADYYGLAGIFKSTNTMENFKVVARWQERPLASAADLERSQQLDAQISQLKQQAEALGKQGNDAVVAEARMHIGDYLLAGQAALERERLLKTMSPIGTGEELPEHALLLEAEQFIRGNVLADDSNYGKGIGVLVNKGQTPNFTEYEFELKTGGSYRIELRYAAASSRPCQLYVNGTLVKDGAAGQVTGSWLPDGQQWFVEGVFEFKRGKNLLRLQQPTFFPHIDKILIAPASEFATTNFEPLDEQYELIPQFVTGWAKFLQTDAHISAPTLKEWHSLQAERDTVPHTAWQSSVRELAKRLQEESNQQKDKRLSKVAADAKGPFAVGDWIESHFPAAIATQLQAKRDQIAQSEEQRPQFEFAMAVSDGAPTDLPVHLRGSHLTLGDVVPRRFPVIFSSDSPQTVPSTHSGRRELAEWLVRPDHPLTARVIVNRVWHWHFGTGLVRTVDNFGLLGEKPSHPELLDWLASEFVQSGWSLKELHRQIMLSSTYQMQAEGDSQAVERDPENRLLSHWQRRRLEAEAIRDAMLACAGTLENETGGTMLPTENRKYVTSTASLDPVVYDSKRRSVYLPVVRSSLYDFFQAFDFADPSSLNGQRQATTVAPQALFMLNSKFVSDRAAEMAHRIAAAESQPSQRIDRAYWLAFCRPASDDEIQQALRFIESYAASWQGDLPEQAAWQAFCRVLMSSNEFVFVE